MASRSPLGSPVGTLSSRPAGGGALLSDTGAGVDFAIGGVGFKVAISDERPYERATAQFRKEQFDAAPKVGDQSLVGWWTRGQLSFHRGAGIEFYEVLDGEAVFDRFNSSSAVDFSNPGSVALRHDADANYSTTAMTDVIDVQASDDKTFFLDSAGGLEHSTYLGAATAYVTTDGGTVVSMSGSRDHGYMYVATSSNGVERFDTVAEALYTHTTAIKDIFFAKDRLWIFDTAGALYVVAANPSGVLPVALAASDKVVTIPPANGGWRFTASPAGVYFGALGGRTVYSLTIAADGSVPILAAPVVAAELPEGESLRGIAYYLGYLVLSTNLGYRVCLVGTDGQITYGPLLFETNGAERMATYGSTVYVVGQDAAGNTTYYTIDLSQPLGDDLRFAYGVVSTTTSSSPVGVTAGNYHGSLIYWTPTTFATERIGTGALRPTGSITTGYHRFGTLELKQFHSVKVRVGGTGGSIAVSRVATDGTETTLHTLDVTQSTGSDITLGLNSPVEAVAIKFTLARDADNNTIGPELLGYQLKALPAPRRQRMIRVPLMLYDVERVGPTRATGKAADAWRRLRGLEELEEAGGTHVYQDFRTGEAGLAYIESIEHRGTTPPGPQDSGFGGIVFLTIRKIDA